MKTFRSRGRISDHFKGVGTVTRDMVEERARELALINGRGPNDYTESDWTEALRELTGVHSETAPEEQAIAGAKRWDQTPGSTGRKVPRVEPSDEQTYAERLVSEGVDEAEHTQMVRGSRDDENQR
jgi:hypothetical protein